MLPEEKNPSNSIGRLKCFGWFLLNSLKDFLYHITFYWRTGEPIITHNSSTNFWKTLPWRRVFALVLQVAFSALLLSGQGAGRLEKLQRQESPSLPSLSSCISAQVRGSEREKNIWIPFGFVVEINDFFDVLKFKVGFFGGFSPLKKKVVEMIYFWGLWFNSSTILRVIDHQQLTESW